MPAILYICTTCRGAEPRPEPVEGQPRPGTQLYQAINQLENPPENVEIREVKCLSVCKKGCSVALNEPGKWSYVYGHMTTEDAEMILEGAAAYAASADGLVPWRERPEIFRKRCLSRVPPLGYVEPDED